MSMKGVGTAKTKADGKCDRPLGSTILEAEGLAKRA